MILIFMEELLAHSEQVHDFKVISKSFFFIFFVKPISLSFQEMGFLLKKYETLDQERTFGSGKFLDERMNDNYHNNSFSQFSFFYDFSQFSECL